MKTIRRLLVMLLICGVAHSEVQIEPPDILSRAISVSVVLDNPKESIMIYRNRVWKNEDIVKLRSMEITNIVFELPNKPLPHMVQVYKGKVFLMHDQGDNYYYKITIPVSEFFKKIFPDYNKVMQAEPQPGAGQPATQPTDKAPVKDQPSTPTPKVGPR